MNETIVEKPEDNSLFIQKPVIKIDVVSDVVCPWCYIGKRRLEKAIAAAGDRFHFDVSYHPFELNPGIPQSGVNQREYLAEKFGGADRYEAITSRTAAMAAEEGIDMDFSKQTISPNTRKAHVLIAAAHGSGKQLAVAEAFFRAYFSEGVDLSDDQQLINVAVSAGLDRILAEAALEQPALAEAIEVQENEARKLGISGVPFYILNNAYGVSGAQTPETFLKVFDELNGSAGVQGATCEPGKDC